MDRREVNSLLFKGGIGVVLAGSGIGAVGCSESSSPTAPSNPGPSPPTTKTLLVAIKQAGRTNARRVQFKGTNAFWIEIDGHTKWLFFHGNTELGVGPPSPTPTIDVSLIEIPIDAAITVRPI